MLQNYIDTLFMRYYQNYFLRVLVYPDNKAQSDDSSSNSKDVGVSSIYHVSNLNFHRYQLFDKGM